MNAVRWQDGYVSCNKVRNERKAHKQHLDQVIKTAVKDLRKGHTAICFDTGQLRSIQRQVECDFVDMGWYYQLTVNGKEA